MQAHDIWKSRRFWSSIMAIVVMLVYNYMPDLDVDPEVLTQGVLAIVGLLVGGFVVEDIVVAARSGTRADKYNAPQ